MKKPGKVIVRKEPTSASKKPKKSPAAVRKTNKRAIASLSKQSKPNGYEIEIRQHPFLLVRYEEALQVRPLLTKLGEESHTRLVDSIAAHGGDSLALALQGASITVNRGVVVAKFSADATRALKVKELRFMVDSSGKHLPTLVGASGKTVENARLLGPLAKGTRIAANLAAAAITAAHIISGIDLAKKMDRLNGKVDFLIAGRRIDQLSRLEGVYCHARELLHGEADDYSQKELHRLGRELFEVRSAWRGEINFHVGSLKKADESVNWFVEFFQNLTRKGKDEKIAETVCACDTEIHLINGSLAIHMALAQAAGKLDTFLQVSLPCELEQISEIRDLLWSRRDFIHEKHPELRSNIGKACYHLDDIIAIYRPMVMPKRLALQNA